MMDTYKATSTKVRMLKKEEIKVDTLFIREMETSPSSFFC